MRIVFMGTPQAAVPILEKIVADGHEVVAVYTQPDRPAGRGNKIRFPAVKEFALGEDIPVIQPLKIKTAEAEEKFRSHNADIAVVVAYGRILPEAFLTAYRYGAVNVHFSLLPKYRGAAPVNWAIVKGEKKTGVTTMKMDAGLDTGDILLQSETDIDENETSIELMQRLSRAGAELLSDTLAGIDTIRPVKQVDGAASLAPILKKDDGLIDWSMGADEIRNRIRGFQPFPTSYTFFEGKRLTIWKAIAADDAGESLEPGAIVTAAGNDLIVGCGKDTFLNIKEAQMEGKRRVATRDLLNGMKIEAGMRLG